MKLLPGQSGRASKANEKDKVSQHVFPSSNYHAYTLIGILVLVVGLGGFGYWAYTAPLSGAVIANGQVVVEGSTKTITHLEGGVVSKIHVDEGDSVNQGEVLLELDDSQARSDLSVVESRLMSALGNRARLRAEVGEADQINFPDFLTEKTDNAEAKQVMAMQRSIFEARRKSLKSDLQLREQRVDELTARISGLKAQISAYESRIASYEDEVADLSGLVDQKLSAKQPLREARRELSEFRGERGRLLSELASVRAKIANTELERNVREEEYFQEVTSKLGEVQDKVLDAQSRISALESKLARTTLYAPIDGSVVGLKVHTEGGVVNPGKPLMNIVPRGRELLVNAQVPTANIDDVEVGQMTDLSFPALNTPFSDRIEGQVVSVSADAMSGEEGENRYYLARVRVNPESAEMLRAESFKLEPGMPVQAFINTDSRSLLDYLLKPMTEMASRAFKES